MNKAKRYYVRKITKTGELIVEKSEIFIRNDYITDVAAREDSEPFDMIFESSDEYAVAVQAAIDKEARLTE